MFYDSAAMNAASAVGTVLVNTAEAEPVKNFIWKLYETMNVTMTEPLPYGKFHLTALISVIALTVLLSFLLRNSKSSTMRLALGFFWMLMIVSEMAEKFVLGTSIEGDILAFTYEWGSFPYQLCATGLWVLPFILVLHDCKVRDYMMIYMGLYSFFGGLLVCLVPTTVFTEDLIVNVHTMIQHGSQVVVGVMLLVYNRKKLNIKNFLGATAVFGVLVCLAIGMNEFFYHAFAAYGNDASFNMFYLSRHFKTDLPVFGYMHGRVPWVLYVMMYVVGFTIISFVIYFVAVLSIHLAEERKYAKAKAVDTERHTEGAPDLSQGEVS